MSEEIKIAEAESKNVSAKLGGVENNSYFCIRKVGMNDDDGQFEFVPPKKTDEKGVNDICNNKVTNSRHAT